MSSTNNNLFEKFKLILINILKIAMLFIIENIRVVYKIYMKNCQMKYLILKMLDLKKKFFEILNHIYTNINYCHF